MASEKRASTKRSNSKLMVLLLTVTLVLGSIIGSTVAWLIDRSDEVVNTFTYGDINISLDETDTDDGDDNSNTNEYKMMPGQDISKDPKVTVDVGNENCWLFVKLNKSTDPDFDDFMTYGIEEEWNLLKGDETTNGEYIYFRYVAADTDNENAVYHVLKDDKVTVKETVTKEQLNALVPENYPSLTLRAYAVQYAGFEVDDIQEGASEAEITAAGWLAASEAWEKVVESESTTP